MCMRLKVIAFTPFAVPYGIYNGFLLVSSRPMVKSTLATLYLALYSTINNPSGGCSCFFY